MKLTSIHHIAIIVSDIHKARSFYVEKLGFKVIRENYREAQKNWKLDLQIGEGENIVELEIFAKENPPKRVTHPEACGLRHLAFHVEDILTAVKELKDLGIECEEIRWDGYTNKRMTFFSDPDGLPIELHE